MPRFSSKIFYILLSIVVAFGCSKDPSIKDTQSLMQIPAGFPKMNIPFDNSYTPERWALGKRLFYDKQLSKNNTISCGSCHMAQHAFSDTVTFSVGDSNKIGSSNVPTLSNIGYHPYFTRAGGVPTLEMQITVPIQEHNEFNSSMPAILEKLSKDSTYLQAARKTYNRELDPFVVTRAIANFERSFITGNAPFDQYFYQSNLQALDAAPLRGYQLFTSNKTNCISCHSGFNFTNYTFENNGLYETYADSGRMRLTKLEVDRARFKVPSLRNIALTAPYMHDGSIHTLKDVVAHYNSGGKTHKHKSTLIRPLQLSAKEQEDLVAFLHSLTDKHFVQNENFKE